MRSYVITQQLRTLIYANLDMEMWPCLKAMTFMKGHMHLLIKSAKDADRGRDVTTPETKL